MAGLRKLKTSLVNPQPGRLPILGLILTLTICLLATYVIGTFYVTFIVDKNIKDIYSPRILSRRDVLQSGMMLVREESQPVYVIPKYALVVEKAQNVVYKPVNVSSQRKSVQKLPLKKLAWLNPPGWMKVEPYTDFTQCVVSDCAISFNRSDVDAADLVLVEGNAIPDAETPTNNPDQIWVFYTAETVQQFYNPRSYRRKDWIGRFNWTMTYRLDSDVVSTYSRLILKEDFVDNANYTDIVHKKTRSVLWFVSHCETQSKRKEYVEELKKYIDVDIYGHCGNLKCKGQECDKLWSKYWFYLSFENSVCKDYVTEKFFNTFNKNIVPVVRGGADYRTLFPPDLYINTADFSSPKALAEHLKALQQDLPGYTNILKNMAKYKQGGNFLKGIPWICDTCAKLHQPLTQLARPCRVLGPGAVLRLILLLTVGLVVVILVGQSKDSIADKRNISGRTPTTTTKNKSREVFPGGVKNESELFRVAYESEWGIPNHALVVEKVRKVVYKPIIESVEIKSVIKRPLKKLAWLNRPTWMNVKPYMDFSGCAVSDCAVSLNRSDVPAADAVLVHIDLLKDTDVPNNNPDQIWVFYTAETIYQFYNPRAIKRADWIGRFNWTLSFRLDSDVVSTYSRLILKEDFVDNANYTDIVHKKTRSVLWFVSHCETQSKRKEYVEELKKYIDVDIYGHCGNLKCKGQECDTIWSKYWFYLSFENSMCKDYVTEKYYKTFDKNIVPVVRGGADYRTLFPPDLNINTADFSSPKALAEHLKALQQDLPGYTKILKNMAKYKQGGNFLKGIPWICDMCAKLHQPLVRKTYRNIYQWWTDGICPDPKDY